MTGKNLLHLKHDPRNKRTERGVEIFAIYHEQRGAIPPRGDLRHDLLGRRDHRPGPWHHDPSFEECPGMDTVSRH